MAVPRDLVTTIAAADRVVIYAQSDRERVVEVWTGMSRSGSLASGLVTEAVYCTIAANALHNLAALRDIDVEDALIHLAEHLQAKSGAA